MVPSSPGRVPTEGVVVVLSWDRYWRRRGARFAKGDSHVDDVNDPVGNKSGKAKSACRESGGEQSRCAHDGGISSMYSGL